LIEVLLNTPHVQELVKKGEVVGVKEALVSADSCTNHEAKINFG
jgi:Tfp pilus assembly ATPase PilU